MPKKKRRTKKQPETVPAPEPIAKIKKRRRRRRRPVAEPIALLEPEPKTLMDLIFESQRQRLERLNEELMSKVTG
jgi:hypothetical protein